MGKISLVSIMLFAAMFLSLSGSAPPEETEEEETSEEEESPELSPAETTTPEPVATEPEQAEPEQADETKGPTGLVTLMLGNISLIGAIAAVSIISVLGYSTRDVWRESLSSIKRVKIKEKLSFRENRVQRLAEKDRLEREKMKQLIEEMRKDGRLPP